MTRNDVCKCLKACSTRNCKKCMLVDTNDCANLLIKKAYAVVCSDTTIIKDLQKECGGNVAQ